jgi:hypothetical protein
MACGALLGVLLADVGLYLGHEEICPGPLPLYFYDLIAPNYSASFCALLGLGAYLFVGFFFACYMQLPVAMFIFTVSRFLGISFWVLFNSALSKGNNSMLRILGWSCTEHEREEGEECENFLRRFSFAASGSDCDLPFHGLLMLQLCF